MCLLFFLLVEQMMHFSNWFHLDYIITRFKSNPCMARFSKVVAAPPNSFYIGSAVGFFKNNMIFVLVSVGWVFL